MLEIEAKQSMIAIMTISCMFVFVDGFIAASRFESLNELLMMIIPNFLLWMLKEENNFN